MSSPDVTIYGAGIFGLSIAYACLQRGARVQVIDPSGIAGGASGGPVGALAPHTPDNWNDKKQFQLESLLMARDFWPDVAVLSGLPTGYTRAGRLQPIVSDRHLELAHTRTVSARHHWGDHALWEVISVGGPWCPPSPTGYAIHDTLSAHIHPHHATHALGQACRALGGTITKAGQAKGQVVEAAGWAGLQALSTQTGRPIGNGVKGQAALLKYPAMGQPQLFADGLHIVPHFDGTVAVGSTSERGFKDSNTTDSLLDDIITKARTLIPALQAAPVIDRWAGVRPRAFTRAPILGRHPMKPDTFIANGGFKIGLGMAPKVGQVMAELILNGRDMIPQAFRIERT